MDNPKADARAEAFTRALHARMVDHFSAGHQEIQVVVGPLLVFVKRVRPHRTNWLIRDMAGGGRILGTGEAEATGPAVVAVSAALTRALRDHGYSLVSALRELTAVRH